MPIRIGTSGWVYKHWRHVFYPDDLVQSGWFSFYAREFDTVEINNSFYRLPSEQAFETWRDQAPPGFLYSVKASRYLTHMKKLKDPEEPLATFLERAQLLRQTLGPILYQLPPHWHADLARLEHFLSVLPEGYRHVLEFRDPSWISDPIFALMRNYNVAHCIHDMYNIEVPPTVTAEPVYIRFHGARDHFGDYEDGVLNAWAARIVDWEREWHSVFVYFNNDPNGYAVKNARTLKQMIGID